MKTLRDTLAPMLFVLMLVTAGVAAAQEAAPPDGPAQAAEPADPMEFLKRLEGTWEGEIDGKLGQGRGVRGYELIMGGRYLVSRHRSVRLPQEKSPEGDLHEELGVFSLDRERGKIVYREFMIEEVVVRSVCDLEGDRLICVSEAVEGGPGVSARLQIELVNPYLFVETYHLGFGGAEPEHYFTNRWTRSPLPFAWD